MWNKYCPMVSEVCTDGETKRSQTPCCHWDSLNAECLIVTQALLSVAFHRRTLAHMDELEEMVKKQKTLAAELEAGMPAAEEFGRSKITRRYDSEASKT